jgi:phosphoribosylformimino-5-aminoimidazole carboxamide ribotide isomerase
MQVIPVLDIRGGQVVHAAGGDRAGYRPIETPLAKGSDPVSVAEGLLRLFPFRQLYLADLDGIGGGDPDRCTIARLTAAWPDVELWVDNGARSPEEALGLLAHERLAAVIGSETWREPERLGELVAAWSGRVVVSLDFRGDTFLGPAALLAQPQTWPDRVIVMTLARVGSGAGPDLERLKQVAALAGPDRQAHAAGGVRGPDDLLALSDAGAAGVLVASALHAGKIKAGDLYRIAGP